MEGFERNLDLLIRNIKADGALPIIFGFLQAQEAFLSKNRPELVGKEKALVIGLARNYEVMGWIAKKYPYLLSTRSRKSSRPVYLSIIAISTRKAKVSKLGSCLMLSPKKF